MKTININGVEAIKLEDALTSMLKDVKDDLYDCARRVAEVQGMIEAIQKIEEENA